MTPDFLSSSARRILILVLTVLATRLHLGGDTVTAVIADIADACVLSWSVYEHYGMVKVPADFVEPTDRSTLSQRSM